MPKSAEDKCIYEIKTEPQSYYTLSKDHLSI